MQGLKALLQEHLYCESYSSYHPDRCSCGLEFDYRHRPARWAAHVAALIEEAVDE